MALPRFILPALTLDPHDSPGPSGVPHNSPGTPEHIEPTVLTRQLTLPSKESHHLLHVLRLRPGDPLEIFARAEGRAFRCSFLKASPAGEAIIQLEQELAPQEPPPVTLLVAAVRSSKLEVVVEKGVELGAAAIHGFFAERSQSPLEGERLKNKEERLCRIRDAALKQSHSSVPTTVVLHRSLEDALRAVHPQEPAKSEHRLVCLSPEETYLFGMSQPALITDIYLKPSHPVGPSNGEPLTALENIAQSVETYVLIGPEGGFTAREAESAVRYRYTPVSLGPTILRTETAAIIAAGALTLLAQHSRQHRP